MVAFPKPPPPDYDYELRTELAALRGYHEQEGKEDRAIPPRSKDRLLVATWNIANLGVQKRRQKDYRLIAEIISWFDLVAIQETNGDLSGLEGIREELPEEREAIFSDPGGNAERLVYLYDPAKVEALEEVGHVTIPPSDFGDVSLPGFTQKFGDDDDDKSIERRCPGGVRTRPLGRPAPRR